jgi:hypothetical protein
VVLARRKSKALWGRCLVVVERDISRKVDCMASSVAGSNFDGFFLWGHLKEQVYVDPPRTIEDLVVRLQAAVTTVDANMLRRVRENAVRRTAVCLEMDGGRLEHLL